MYFNKYPSPLNFRYVDRLAPHPKPNGSLSLRAAKGDLTFALLDDGLLHVRSTLSAARAVNYSSAELASRPRPGVAAARRRDEYRLSEGESEVRVTAATGEFEFLHRATTVLRTSARPFGVCGTKSIVLLDRPRDTVVYGLGEKTGGIDKSNRSYKMWNTDAAFDFLHTFTRDDYDPAYVSIPFFISKSEDDYYGVLIDNPYATFFHTGLKPGKLSLIPAGLGREDQESLIALGADDGLFELYVIPGPTLGDVVRRFARLTGRHELPPIWALGYHQCRWGYKSAKELADVSARLAREKIPAGAVWADIDYMDGYRVFTWNEKTFSKKDREKCFGEIEARGTRVVTIVDPGVKAEPGYPVHDEGMKRDVFCITPEGSPYIGFVWPGKTLFPDFSLPEAREFWARHIKDQLECGLAGIWIDMNDPATGTVELDDMRFQRGKVEHAAFHNQYGHLMARATWEGFARKDPNARPFVLTRSGYTGTQKYSAIWTGDNASNEAHLAMSIPMSINLSLSGVSFNGPDVGGFACDTTESLMTTWMRAGALFPFFRNHSTIGSRPQEPWAFSRRALSTIRKCILTRARLLPYLYNQFFLHWRDGDAVMRPLSYEFSGTKYERIGDQFMIGPSLMLAPFVQLEKPIRSVELPPGWWFSLQTGTWQQGGRTIRVKNTDDMIVFVRDGSILPCVDMNHLFPQPDFHRVAFHVFCKQRDAKTEYYEDDGATRAYQKGDYNLFDILARKGGRGLRVTLEQTHTGLAEGLDPPRFLFYGLAPEGASPTTERWPFRSYSVRAWKG